jgi:hypothetical protein
MLRFGVFEIEDKIKLYTVFNAQVIVLKKL